MLKLRPPFDFLKRLPMLLFNVALLTSIIWLFVFVIFVSLDMTEIILAVKMTAKLGGLCALILMISEWIDDK